MKKSLNLIIPLKNIILTVTMKIENEKNLSTVVIFMEFLCHFTPFYGNLRKLATIRQKNLRQTTKIFDYLRQYTIFDDFL
jgi:hypothetical protein